MTDAEFITMRRGEGAGERRSNKHRPLRLSHLLLWLRGRTLG